jgi:hypothetical protein
MTRISRFRASVFFAVLLIGIHCAALRPAFAAEWSLEPGFSARQEYNTNYALTPLAHVPTWATTVTPTMRLNRKLETLDVSAVASLNSTSFSNDEGQDRVDPRVALDAVLRRERDTFRMATAYLRDTTLTNDALATGVQLVRAGRETITANPSWQHNLSERMTTTVDYTFGETRYADQTGPGLTNFRSEAVAASLRRNVDERTLVTAILSKSTFRTSPETTRSDTLSARGAIDYEFSQKVKGSLSLGLSSTDTKNTRNATVCPTALILCQFGLVPFQQLTQANSSHSNTWLANADLSDALTENTTLTLHANRDVYPSGAGSLTQTDKVSAGLSTAFTERLTATLNATITRAQIPQSSSVSNSAESRLSYKIDRALTADVGARYVTVKYQGTDTAVNAKAIYIYMRYEWPAAVIAH